MEIKRLALVMVDISGYTNFVRLHTMSLLHAEAIITDLLEAVIDRSEFPLTLSKLEGDAAFLYAEMGQDERASAQDILRQVAAFFEAFTEKERSLIACDSCMCVACRSIDRLRLKALVHSGEVAIKQIKQFEELAGEDVILIHRLLKNSIPDKEYILLTRNFFDLSGGYAGEQADKRTETIEGMGSVEVYVYYPAINRMLPTQPRVNFPTPDSDFRAIADRWNDYARRRIQGSEPRRKFSSLPDKKMTLWSWLDYFVLSDIVSAIHINWRKLTRRD